MKILDTNKFEIALIEMQKFKKELKDCGFRQSSVIQKQVHNPTLLDYATAYLNSMSGENTPAILIRLKSKSHIDDTTRIIFRFFSVLKKAGYNYKTVMMNEITDTEVSLFHEYLLNSLQLKQRSYNKHIVAMRTFYNWVIRVKDYKCNNPFNHVELKKSQQKEKNIITKLEFDRLLSVVTPENGVADYYGENRNYYSPQLKHAFRLALETGCRTEELVVLKWSDINNIHGIAPVITINNLKVNRIKTGGDNGIYIRNIPITKGLQKLLDEMDYVENHGQNRYIIPRNENQSVQYLMRFISQAFAHFIKIASSRKIQFKDLRKTYITMASIALGDKAKIFTGHAGDDVLRNHYIANAYVVGKLGDFCVFE